MGARSEGSGHSNNWKLLIGLSVLCAVVVFLGGFLHRRALDSAIADRQAKSVAFVNTKVAAAAKHADLSKPMKDAETARFTKQLDVPPGTDLRLFSVAGVPLYSSPGLAPFPADTEGIQTAAAGDQGRVVDGSDLRIYTPVDGTGAKPVAIAAVVSNYTQMRHDASGPLDAIRVPVVGLGIVLLIAGLLLMLQATKGGSAEKTPSKTKEPAKMKLGRKSGEPKPASSSKGRVTGFDPVPVTIGRQSDEPEEDEPVAEAAASVAPEVAVAEAAETGKTVFGLRLGAKRQKKEVAAPDEPAADAPAKAKRSPFSRKEVSVEAAPAVEPLDDKAASALEREVAIREALEDQLAQLRTRIQMQEVETNNATKELLAQIEAANRRAEEAEARAKDAGGSVTPAPAASPPPPVAGPDESALRVQQLEREIAEARAVTADAVARAETLQRQLDEALAAPVAAPSDPNAEAKIAEAMTQLADAQQRATAAEQRASAAEQRAASVESVRDELEVRVAQLGTKATELEQRASELEISLKEANAGGDAVRAEIATLTAALAAANARATELESAPPTPAHNEEDQAEIARLRSELANHMERAQAAEERVATLEADVLAAQRGVPALGDDESPSHDASPSEGLPRPAERGAEHVAEVNVASRFADDLESSTNASEADVSTAVPENAAPHVVTDRAPVPEVHGAEAEQDEPEPEMHEAEPEQHDPEQHDPEQDEPEQDEPEQHQAEHELETQALETAEPAVDVPAQPPSYTWTSLAAQTHGDVRPATPFVATSQTSGEVEDRSESGTSAQGWHPVELGSDAPHPTDVERDDAAAPSAEALEPASVEADDAAAPSAEALEPASVEADDASDRLSPAAFQSEPAHVDAAELDATSAQTEVTATVEWRSPSVPAPAAVTSPPLDPNGIPPAPSDDARYDDIWTAAFAPPEQATSPVNGERRIEAVDAATSEPVETTDDTAAVTDEVPPDTSPDDLPSPPEDEISAEDDMWSLRARLADAAARKRLPHEID